MFNKKKKPAGHTSLQEQLEKAQADHKGGDHGKGHAGGGDHGGGAGAQLVAFVAEGLGRMFGGLMPASFKRAELKDTAAQVIKTPLGGSITGTYTTNIVVEADPEIAKLIAEAQELTERASIDADKEVQLALNAGKHEGEHGE